MPVTKKFSEEDLRELTWGDGPEDLVKIREHISEHNRWSVVYEVIFRQGDRYYLVCYYQPATEYQDCDTFPWAEDGMVECTEVVPTPKTVIQYVAKEEEEQASGTDPKEDPPTDHW